MHSATQPTATQPTALAAPALAATQPPATQPTAPFGAAIAPQPTYAAAVTARPDNRRVLHLVDDGMLGKLRHLG